MFQSKLSSHLTVSLKEKDDMIKWSKEIEVDSIYLTSLSNGRTHTAFTNEIKDKWNFLVPKEKEFRRNQFSFDYPICGMPLKQSVIYWNGNLGLCCIDYSNDIKLANIKPDESYAKPLFPDELIKKRKQVFF